ncbi:MAG: GldG family protein [Caldicoprobacterales bacterium]|nr:GldG family protein [Clostridiales bacterium]
MKFANKKVFQSFKSRKFKYGSYATLMTLIVIAVLIVVNLVVDMIPVRIDLTWNKLYSLSEQTYKVLDNLEDEIWIYYIGEEGNTNPAVEEIVQRYASYSSLISTGYMDPVRDPITAQKYIKDGDQLSAGSLIVECGDVYRVITQYDMYNFVQTASGLQVESMAVEQRLTSAIMFVSGASMPVAYQLEGHGEAPLDAATARQMELENFHMESLNLIGLDKVPEDADLLIINGPERDLSEEEADVLKAYLENKGRAIFLMNLRLEDMANFQSVFRTYGFQLSNSLVIEGEQGNYVVGNPLYLIPQINDHEIVAPIKNQGIPVIIPGAQAIEVQDTVRNTLTIQPLLTTSEKAYARSTDSEETSLEKQEDDESGSFVLAAAIEDNIYNYAANETYMTRIVVIGSSQFLNTGWESSTDLFMNSLNWIFEREDSISIRPKSLGVQPLNVTSTQLRIYAALSLIVIPLGCMILGLVTWLRRRNL